MLISYTLASAGKSSNVQRICMSSTCKRRNQHPQSLLRIEWYVGHGLIRKSSKRKVVMSAMPELIAITLSGQCLSQGKKSEASICIFTCHKSGRFWSTVKKASATSKAERTKPRGRKTILGTIGWSHLSLAGYIDLDVAPAKQTLLRRIWSAAGTICVHPWSSLSTS